MDTVAPIRKHHWSMTLLGVALIIGFAYYGESVLSVLFFAVLLSFVLEPLVEFFSIHFRMPRAMSALTAVILMLVVLYGISYASYSRALVFIETVPQYSQKIRSVLRPFRQEAEKFQKSQEAMGEPEQPNVINVRPVTDWADILTHGVSSMTEALLAASFIPFLAYFLLTWKHHARSATVMLFPLEHRHTAYVTLGLIGKMLQSFIVGNLLIGLLISGLSIVIFWMLGVPFPYFIGFASGFLSLVPYLGLVLAMVPPIVVGLGQLDAGGLLALAIMVILLHLFALNVLYPKMLGSRLKLNPLAVTIALLFWGWIWGAVGLLLAIPITGALKIIFDHVESMNAFAAWLGE